MSSKCIVRSEALATSHRMLERRSAQCSLRRNGGMETLGGRFLGRPFTHVCDHSLLCSLIRSMSLATSLDRSGAGRSKLHFVLQLPPPSAVLLHYSGLPAPSVKRNLHSTLPQSIPDCLVSQDQLEEVFPCFGHVHERALLSVEMRDVEEDMREMVKVQGVCRRSGDQSRSYEAERSKRRTGVAE